MPDKTADLEFIRQTALAHPAAVEGTIHGRPAFKLHGRVVACPAIHSSAEPNSLVVAIDRAQRAMLIAEDPAVFYVVDHYAPHDAVLVRLSRIGRKALRELLARAVAYVESQPAIRRRTRKSG